MYNVWMQKVQLICYLWRYTNSWSDVTPLMLPKLTQDHTLMFLGSFSHSSRSFLQSSSGLLLYLSLLVSHSPGFLLQSLICFLLFFLLLLLSSTLVSPAITFLICFLVQMFILFYFPITQFYFGICLTFLLFQLVFPSYRTSISYLTSYVYFLFRTYTRYLASLPSMIIRNSKVIITCLQTIILFLFVKGY